MAGHRDFVAKIQRLVGPELETGEKVQEACACLSESPPTSFLFGMIAVAKMIGGNRPQNMVVLLTDRRLCLAHAHVTIGMKSAEIIRTFPRAEAAANLRLSGNTLSIGAEDVIVSAIAHHHAAERMIAAVSPARTGSADAGGTPEPSARVHRRDG